MEIRLSTLPSPPPSATLAQAPARSRLRRAIRAAGIVFLCFVVGAATMFFQLPLSAPLSKAFMGIRAWVEAHAAGRPADPNGPPALAGDVDVPGQTYDGYTLLADAANGTLSNRVSLIDMQRREVHHWTVSISRIWPNAPHLGGRQVDDSQACVFACHLYANGDLLVVFHAMERTVRGYGLAKVDKNSNLIWAYAGNAHHDVTVGEDGTIYTLAQRQMDTPIPGMESVPTPWLVDHVVMLSPDGKEIRPPISLVEALRNSPYATLLTPLETPLDPEPPLPALTDEMALRLRLQQDVLHANSVAVLSSATAPAFPAFRPGQVLVSMRGLGALAVIDPATGKAVWGTCGPWHMQHDARFLPSGRLMLFDNVGSRHGSRVLEFDPKDDSFPWSYPGANNAPFLSKDRGAAQRLPNGNTLIAISGEKRMIEVSPTKEVVWSCNPKRYVATARRYGPNEIAFLPPGCRPRD